jgi:hypothetical protein
MRKTRARFEQRCSGCGPAGALPESDSGLVQSLGRTSIVGDGRAEPVCSADLGLVVR